MFLQINHLLHVLEGVQQSYQIETLKVRVKDMSRSVTLKIHSALENLP